jgi:hypothetical protein
MAENLRPGFPGKNRLPLQAGTNIKGLTEMEKSEFAKLGWKEGEAIPLNLAEALAQLKNEAIAETASSLPVAPNTPPIQITESPIDSLSPEHRRELEIAVRTMIDADKVRQSLPPMPLVDASVQEALHVAAQAEARGVTEPEPTPAVTPALAPDTGVVPPPLTVCPHCAWDLTQPDEMTPTEDDKYHFLQAMLGGLPMRKAISMFGGSIVVTLRSLTSSEAILADVQTFADAQAGKCQSTLEFQNTRYYYRAALGIESVKFPTGMTVTPRVSALALKPDANGVTPETVLPALRKIVEETILTQEPLRRAAGRAFMKFERMVEALEAAVDNPDFSWGIASQG